MIVHQRVEVDVIQMIVILRVAVDVIQMIVHLKVEADIIQMIDILRVGVDVIQMNILLKATVVIQTIDILRVAVVIVIIIMMMKMMKDHLIQNDPDITKINKMYGKDVLHNLFFYLLVVYLTNIFYIENCLTAISNNCCACVFEGSHAKASSYSTQASSIFFCA